MKMTRDRLARVIVCNMIDGMNVKELANFAHERLLEDADHLDDDCLLDMAVVHGVLTSDEADELEGKLG